MIDIEEVPDPRLMPANSRRATHTLLEQVVNRPPHRLRWTTRGGVLLSLGVAAVLSGGAATAYVALTPAPVTDNGVARCYSQPSLAGGDDFPGTSVALAAPRSGRAQITDAVQLCAQAWRDGAVTGQGPASGGAPRPVPQLVECTLPSGIAAVFPGASTTCQKLGLAPTTHR